MSAAFIDQDGDTYEATSDTPFESEAHTIELKVAFAGSANTDNSISFYASDAVKIIALIAEAAAPKPIPKTREEMAAFATAWDAKVEANTQGASK